jgi:hypothetical protein
MLMGAFFMNFAQILRRSPPYLITFMAGALASLVVRAYPTALTDPPIATLTVGVVAATIAIVAVFMSYRTIQAGRHNAKATVTFQHIAKLQHDAAVIDARLKVRAAIQTGNIGQWALPGQEASPTAVALVALLNDFEIMAIGIKRGIVDCNLYRQWCEKGAIKFWQDVLPFVTALRTEWKNRKIYLNVEEMIDEWDIARPNYKSNPNSPFAC